MKQYLPYAIAKLERCDESGAGMAAKADAVREIHKWIVAFEQFRDKAPTTRVAELMQVKVDDLREIVKS